jgi:hypothetical protein
LALSVDVDATLETLLLALRTGFGAAFVALKSLFVGGAFLLLDALIFVPVVLHSPVASVRTSASIVVALCPTAAVANFDNTEYRSSLFKPSKQLFAIELVASAVAKS